MKHWIQIHLTRLIAAKSKENFAIAAKQTAQAQYQLAKTGLEVGNIRLANKRTANFMQ